MQAKKFGHGFKIGTPQGTGVKNALHQKAEARAQRIRPSAQTGLVGKLGRAHSGTTANDNTHNTASDNGRRGGPAHKAEAVG